MPPILLEQPARIGFHPYQSTSSAAVVIPAARLQRGSAAIVSDRSTESDQDAVDGTSSPRLLRSQGQGDLLGKPTTVLGNGPGCFLSESLYSQPNNLPTPSSPSAGIQTSSTPKPVSPARAPARPRPVEDIVSYLKQWRPPVEYYARRRYQHPSLSYPSRRPSLPSLLEERMRQDGVMDLVRPELAMPVSPHVHRPRKLFPKHLSLGRPSDQRVGNQSWDDEEQSDENMDSEDDEEEGDWSDSDEDEAITPGNSPSGPSLHFLQPIILTKLPGY